MIDIPTPRELIETNADVEAVVDRFLKEIKSAIDQGLRKCEVSPTTDDIDGLAIELLREKGWEIYWNSPCLWWEVCW